MRLRNVLHMSGKHLGNLLGRTLTWWFNLMIRLENVLKMPWGRMTKTNLLVLIKTSSRCLEDAFWRRRQKTSSRRLQNIFIKTNVCWVIYSSTTNFVHLLSCIFRIWKWKRNKNWWLNPCSFPQNVSFKVRSLCNLKIMNLI